MQPLSLVNPVTPHWSPHLVHGHSLDSLEGQLKSGQQLLGGGVMCVCGCVHVYVLGEDSERRWSGGGVREKELMHFEHGDACAQRTEKGGELWVGGGCLCGLDQQA